MLPHVFKSPEKYDPDRYAAPREEDKQIPFGYIGFGGGRHGCLGSNFAYLQIKVCARFGGAVEHSNLYTCLITFCAVAGPLRNNSASLPGHAAHEHAGHGPLNIVLQQR